MIKNSYRKILSHIFCLLLLAVFFGCAAMRTPTPLSSSTVKQNGINVGFDVDDTLLFSTPAFKKADDSGETAYSENWWTIVNKSDGENSIVKKVTEKILNGHKQKGDEIFMITSRGEAGGDYLRDFLNKIFGVKKENIYFEHDKADRIKKLRISIYYGDSDSDITASQDAGAKGIRIMRSPKSSYEGKYHPGEFGEEIIPDSEE